MADGTAPRSVLYCGPDLHNAARLSSLDRSIRDRYIGLANGLGVFVDAVRHRRQQSDGPRFELVIATGQIRGTSSTASVAYAGNGVNRDWCVGTTVSGHADIETRSFSSARETRDELRKTIEEVDIVFIDDLGEDLVAGLQTDFLRIPAWIKQRVRIADDWRSQIQSLKRGTRQEVSRVLRKYGFGCRLTCEAIEVSRFYDQQYRPYISSLYGESAIIVDRDRFIRECRRGVLLQLMHHEKVVACALLRPIGRTMAIVWTGMSTAADNKRVPGATDALDYFSLLYAYLGGFHWLDFGPSRPDLLDGTLRYKTKWGSEIAAGHFAQPTIYWTCSGRSAAVKQFLQRHTFVSNMNGEHAALFFWVNNDDPEILFSDLKKLLVPGISKCRVVSLSPLPKDVLTSLKDIHPRITVAEAQSVAEALRLASEVRVTQQ